MKILCIIPARYESSRFPGKPLAKIGGKPMIQMTYERCVATGLFDKVVVATDNDLIVNAINSFKGNVVMTSKDHPSGTDRCFEAFKKLGNDYDAILNVQGDEPFISTESIAAVVKMLKSDASVATLVVHASSINQVMDPNKVKVVLNSDDEAMYFSRSPVPFIRDVENDNWLGENKFYIHLGIYGFNANVIPEIIKMPKSRLESLEKLEQLKWLENGVRIKCGLVEDAPLGVDTPEDLKNAEQFFLKQKL